MLPYLNIGPVMVQLPGLALLLGLWLGMELSARQAVRLGLSGERVVNLILWGLGIGAVTARLGYALRYPDAFLSAPLSLLSLNPQTLDPWFGLLGGLIAAWAYGQRVHLPLRPLLDALAPGLATFAVFVGVAHVLSGDAYGMPTSLPWGIELWGAKRHPTQFYEVLLTTGVLAWVGEQGRKARGDGTLFLATAGLLAAVRLFVEGFRGDSLTMFGGLRVAQMVALAGLLLVVWLYPFWRQNPVAYRPNEKASSPRGKVGRRKSAKRAKSSRKRR